MNGNMTHKVVNKLGENIFLILALLWVLLWIFPWAIWLDPLPWIRLGISIIMFVAPGMTISLFLAGKRLSLPSHFTSGLAFSVLLVGILGLLGRKLHLPFEFIKPIFALTGLIGLIALFKYTRSEHRLYKPKSFPVATLALLLFMVVFGIIINLQSRFGGDDFSYLAYLTNWQHAHPLDFQEVVFGSGEIAPIRFWLAMFPMTLAFLAEISHLHGLLLLGFYLEPYLVIIAILAIYNFYEDLLQSEHLTIAALILQFAFFVLLQGIRQPGSTFFNRLSEDKAFAAFVLAPVFFLAIRYFLDSFTPRSGIFALLSGLSLTLTHPVILAFSIFIAGLYTGIVTIPVRHFKKLGVVAVLLMVVILPLVSLRFIDGPSTNRYAVDLESALDKYGIYSETRISYIEGTPFYGLDLESIKIQTSGLKQENPLQVFLSWSYLWLLGLGLLWSLFNLKKSIAAPFIAATSVLISLCAIPYTGWLLGYFVSAGMLWRSPWLLPIGLIGVVLLTQLLKFALYKGSAGGQPKTFEERATFSLTLATCFILIGYFFIHGHTEKWKTLMQLDRYSNRLEKLSILGNYFENNIENPSIFVAPTGLADYLPGLSSKSKPVFFRTARFTPHFVNMEKINLIFSDDMSISIKQRMNILKKYHVQYILTADNFLMDYYAGDPELFGVQKVDSFWIIEFREMNP